MGSVYFCKQWAFALELIKFPFLVESVAQVRQIIVQILLKFFPARFEFYTIFAYTYTT